MPYRESNSALRSLASHCGVQIAYYDILTHRRRMASPESLVAVLRSLGVPLSQPEDAPRLLRQRRLAHWAEALDPVLVAWEGHAAIPIRLPQDGTDRQLAVELKCESGDIRDWRMAASSLKRVAKESIDKLAFETRSLRINGKLPYGYHRLTVRFDEESWQALLISAPLRSYPVEGLTRGRKVWGVSAPVYSLRSRKNWGAGDFSDLSELLRLTRSWNGEFVLTLPLLPVYPDPGSSPSPYSPVSRLLWNEFYVDIESLPEFRECERAQALASSERSRRTLSRLRSHPTVRYDEIWKLKRRALETLAEFVSHDTNSRGRAFRRYRKSHPLLRDYACFRSYAEGRGRTWRNWTTRARKGSIPSSACDQNAARYHEYVQWVAAQQVAGLSAGKPAASARLMLDLPIGVHPAGFDAWRFQESFAEEVWTGAPPDQFFVQGQNWRFPPPHPWKQRIRHYEYFIRSLRHSMSAGDLLRLDHVMSLHRLFWIPEGADASDGVYVRYPTEEMFAILTLESHRNCCVVIGENLGTVPKEIQRRLHLHGVLGTTMLQFGLRPQKVTPLRRPGSDEMAAMNTHDTPTFAGFWKRKDITLRSKLKLLTAREAATARSKRRQAQNRVVRWLRSHGQLTSGPKKLGEIYTALMEWIAWSRSPLLLVSLEDLWGNERQQNVPGLASRTSNWSQKLRYTLEEIASHPGIALTLKGIDRARGGERT